MKVNIKGAQRMGMSVIGLQLAKNINLDIESEKRAEQLVKESKRINDRIQKTLGS